MKEKNSVKILIVDDEENMRFLLKEELEEEGYEVYNAASGEEALEVFRDNEIDVATIDIEMPGMDGRELAGRLRKEKPEIKILFLTAYSHYKHDLSSWAADAYIVKSADLNELKNKIKQLLK
ncbi:MAG: response regulator [Kosmotoga sp.]|nr:MAG: response regulator [Kosmotoga sp.]